MPGWYTRDRSRPSGSGRDRLSASLPPWVQDGGHEASEDHVALGLKQPWVSLGSDAASSAPGGGLMSSTHPRASGNFARFSATTRGIASWCRSSRRSTA